MAAAVDKLAIDGGTPVASEAFPVGFLGSAEIGEPEIEAVTSVLRSKTVFRFLDPGNSWCTRLETKFKNLTGREHALAVGGGTAALVCGFAGVGIGDGDEVIIPGYTYIATAAAILVCGAVPVICEVDETLTMDPADVEKKITPRTKAIVPVHMRGLPCDMDRLVPLARKHNLLVVEDVAQACGGSYKGRPLGSFGEAGCFSLQQYKVITAGEGGIVVTDNAEVFQRAALRHDSAMLFWQPGETTVRAFPGTNFRMNELEGALGCVQFDRLESILARTRKVKRGIVDGLQGVDGVRLAPVNCPDGDLGIAAILLCETGERAKRFAAALNAEGIPASSIYDKTVPDRHIYCHWEYVMEMTSSDAHGRPWTSPLHDQNRRYSPDMCPQTLDVLGRSIHIDITQRYEQKHVDWIVQAVRKVAAALA
ncbi:MAG TPA: DegT/DnrJ/EryC1/StrS family aminotransferase [Candidatus Hydrogenedentes bacterium]|jgi:8-amino-3,8-dideoxy-alpha-D-manno-octulosonate transaminase|nr:DegT/DnrJ/EryC1/StrS family aminotransferase [Candidatus Hydrogenedentota bacterium]MDY0033656.1 DegT/DnrJ/EryC1/StrS family aminotransferase [FCB group bacterium]HNV21135.1 DegT/DnrJ/EryC1/StrS family aminotransferase [Candidatus Hydrogenedentota bacterium]